MSQIIWQDRCVSNRYELNVRFIWELFYQNLSWVATPGVLQHFTLFTFFYSLQVEESKKGAGFNKRAGTIVSFNINKPAGSNKAMQGDIMLPKRINAHASLLNTSK